MPQHAEGADSFLGCEHDPHKRYGETCALACANGFKRRRKSGVAASNLSLSVNYTCSGHHIKHGNGTTSVLGQWGPAGVQTLECVAVVAPDGPKPPGQATHWALIIGGVLALVVLMAGVGAACVSKNRRKDDRGMTEALLDEEEEAGSKVGSSVYDDGVGF